MRTSPEIHYYYYCYYCYFFYCRNMNNEHFLTILESTKINTARNLCPWKSKSWKSRFSKDLTYSLETWLNPRTITPSPSVTFRLPEKAPFSAKSEKQRILAEEDFVIWHKNKETQLIAEQTLANYPTGTARQYSIDSLNQSTKSVPGYTLKQPCYISLVYIANSTYNKQQTCMCTFRIPFHQDPTIQMAMPQEDAEFLMYRTCFVSVELNI